MMRSQLLGFGAGFVAAALLLKVPMLSMILQPHWARGSAVPPHLQMFTTLKIRKLHSRMIFELLSER
jgi:hypothetical protein